MLLLGMSSVPPGTENSQKWIPVPNILGSVTVRYRYLRVKTVTELVSYQTGTENVKNRYRKGTRFGKFGTSTGSILLIPSYYV
ncbi:hypothetical protein HanIR_Chr10g0471891 [Helianthus annuus]|nr:hypothetical protein HanIR_Chr10g0471891 [Helianthus annuus]